ncbi:cell wall hydrolase [Bacillus sp. FJAT-49711]|uniref:cell wall hydrolase n=1 Tax=Bacillus sp. FJAT-49711 TaxID=2833585 RepID=UPI001BCA5184|nr:cell wall hydrolase [Bacillus sp. FJAT-49711]MBS4218424.1 cell wall hydrolase [Bacillus sp. FJAT-49711]
MKNIYIKTFVAACIAAFIFIGLQSGTAEARTEYRVVKGDSLWGLGQKYSVTIDNIKLENNRRDDLIYIGELLQIPNKVKGVAVHSAKPKKETRKNKLAKPEMSISQKEKDLFARLVEAEAKGESYKGKVAVATVVLNRVESPKFPDTITGVIKQVVGSTYAFSPVKNGQINKPASDESERAVDEALLRKDRLKDSIYFYNPDIATDKWIRTRDVVKTIGNHVFAK